MRRNAALGALALLAAAGVAGSQLASGHALPSASRCPVFPANNQWNLPVDKLPLASDSDTLVRSIGSDASVHPDFGSGNYNGGPIGIPYTTVSSRQHKVRVRFQYSDESNRGPYPIPTKVPIEGGRNSSGDRHAIIVDRTHCKLYELYALYPPSGGKGWTAGSGAIWSLRSNKLRPKTWTSADAAGLPILPGARALRRGQEGLDRPRAALHGLADAQHVHLPRAPRRIRARATRACPRWASASA